MKVFEDILLQMIMKSLSWVSYLSRKQNDKQVEELRNKGDRWQGEVLTEYGNGVGSRAQVKELVWKRGVISFLSLENGGIDN